LPSKSYAQGAKNSRPSGGEHSVGVQFGRVSYQTAIPTTASLKIAECEQWQGAHEIPYGP